MYRSRASGFDTIGQMFNLAVPAARCASSRYAGSAAASSLKRRAARAIAPVMRKVCNILKIYARICRFGCDATTLYICIAVRRAMSVRDALSTRLTLDSIYSPIALTATCIAHVRGGRRGLGMRRHYRNDAGERHFGHADCVAASRRPSSAWWHANLAYAGLARFAMARFRASAALRVRMGELGGIKSCESAHSVPQLSFSPPILTQRARGDRLDARRLGEFQRYKDERVCGLKPQLPLSPPISTSTASWKEGQGE
ncbi:hypothetical protein DFH11DRAFT_1546713 [Phellopilus nigrolimitatus]|nr:hypothetical protein DFH11DRAFT_1546705 [Phellopilus nigrolimitatus]KAH8111319.1 hypothetical protein DFH11DRAFT_1546713 [Phellopilus nigrolimitatus]